jgi:hypothetical protein
MLAKQTAYDYVQKRPHDFIPLRSRQGKHQLAVPAVGASERRPDRLDARPRRRRIGLAFEPYCDQSEGDPDGSLSSFQDQLSQDQKGDAHLKKTRRARGPA